MEEIDKEQETISWFKEWSDKKVFNGKNIKELLAYEDISFWWFFDFYLYNHLIERIHGDKKEKKKSTLKKAFASWYIVLRTLVRKFYGHIFMPIPREEKKTVLILSHRVNWRKSRKGVNLKEDQLFGGIIENLKKQEIRTVAIDRNHVTGIKTLNEKRHIKKGLWRPVETYIKFTDILYALKANLTMKRRFNKYKSSTSYINSFIMKNNASPNIKDVMELAFSYIPMEAYLQTKAIENAIDKENIDLVILSHEYGVLGKAALIAGKRKHVPTIVLQHGIIHPHHMGYFHTKNEIGDWAPIHCPIPDKIVVYGKYTHDILIDVCNYPPGSVAIIGQPKYDILSEPNKIYNREEFYMNNKVTPKKTNILVTTQPFPIFKHRDTFLRNIMKLAENPDVQLIVKPHPGEDSAWHLKIMEEEGIKVPIINPKSDIFEAIYATDITATCSSTTATEAIILNKMVLIVNLTGQKDPMPYVSSGAAVGVYTEEALNQTFQNILIDQNLSKDLLLGREKFIHEHLYRIDGKSTERFVKLVKQMLGQ
jgi:hypothetical protein